MAQCFVAVAIISDIISFQFKKKKNILILLIISAIFISLHFFFMHNNTAGLLVLVSILRYIFGIMRPYKIYCLFLVAISALICLFTYSGFLSLMSFSGFTFNTIAAFCKTDKNLREMMFVGTSIWLVHNFLLGSPGAVIMELLFLTTDVVGYYRFYIRRKPQ